MLDQDSLLNTLEYLPIDDAFAFMKTNKIHWKICGKSFKRYPNKDLCFVALINIEDSENMRSLFTNLYHTCKKYRGIVIQELMNKENVPLINKVIGSGYYDEKFYSRNQKLNLMKLSRKELDTIYWVYKKYHDYLPVEEVKTSNGVVTGNMWGNLTLGASGLNFDHNPNKIVIIGDHGSIPFNSKNVIILGCNGVATEDGMLVLGGYKSPLKLIDDKYIRVSVNGRTGKIPIIFDD